MPVAAKRVYDPPARSDGVRVLVDRLWPRGLTKTDAAIDLWLKDIAPSNELRRWYHERPAEWVKFRDRYLEELREDRAAAALETLYGLANGRKRITLLFASRNEERNNATVLKELLEGKPKPPRGTGPIAATAARKVAQRR